VVLGDGNLNIHGYNAEILLSVTDCDFAKEFSKCLAKILSRENPYQVRRSEKRNRWIVQGASVLLYRFLKTPWAKPEALGRTLRKMHSRFPQSIL
jgi:intein-encoded DNA endonuclease-like protein